MAENNTDSSASKEPPVLNISGQKSTGRRIRRNKTKQSKQVVDPKVYDKQFATQLDKLLLKSNANPGNFQDKYLCCLCLKDVKRNVRIYHLFYSNVKDLGKDYENTRNVYVNSADIKFWNNVTTQTICPELLLREAKEIFKQYKWSKDGSVMETPMSEIDEWILSNKLSSLNNSLIRRLFNYIMFLKSSKV